MRKNSDFEEFRNQVWEKSKVLYRDMPWRDAPTFYHVLVSEIMLQQTQVSRVLIKYRDFMDAFPSIQSLADADLPEVLRIWQGLGYNRRAKYLHQAAKNISMGQEIASIEDLMSLPGIGRNTAAAIMNYVYEKPTPYVETNIRTVYFNHFFQQQKDVRDAEVLELVSETLDKNHPRQWFWALMDYGAWLKTHGYGQLKASSSYKKQSKFSGSVRQMRGEIVRRQSSGETLVKIINDLHEDPRFDDAIEGLRRDGLLLES